jgi:ABC-2 type transport system permease protein
VLVTGGALLLGWQPRGWVLLIPGLILGTISLSCLGMAVAGVLRAEATLAVANALFLVLLLAGGTVLPTTTLPGPLAAVVTWLPTAALGDWLRQAASGDGVPPVSVAVLIAWMVVGITIVARRFRWT